MKYAILLLSMVVYTSVLAQQKIITNNIDVVTNLNINGSNAKINVGKIIINQGLQAKLYLIETIQNKDTSGYYITTFFLGNKENLPIFDLNLSFSFDGEIEGWLVQAEDAKSDGVKYDFTNKKLLKYQVAQITWLPNSTHTFYFSFKSKKKVFTTISGLDGALSTD